MPQPVAGATEGCQVVGLISPSMLPWHDVMDLEKPGSSTTRCAAMVLVAGQHLSSDAGRNGRGVSSAWAADCRIAAHSFGFGPTEFAFS